MTRTDLITAAIAKGQAELAAHVASGTIPGDLAAFVDVDDMNAYGGCFGIWADHDIEAGQAIVGAVFEGLDAWIKTGALRPLAVSA